MVVCGRLIAPRATDRGKPMLKSIAALTITIISISAYAADGNPLTVPVSKTVDTGSHTCTKIGQEKKVYDVAEAGQDRYFVNDSLATVSMFREGNCTYESDGGGPSVTMGRFSFKDADGNNEVMEKPVRYVIRAFGDCTNNPANLGKSMGTECRFTATSKRGTPAP